ncbi:MAG: hypothetical protein LAT66_11305 [Alkalimonas sp.]|nr:hypothetical protein [Alkalimonas sp.]
MIYFKSACQRHQSQLAGFFALCLVLTACQPNTTSPEQEMMQEAGHNPAVAYRLAQHRLASNETDAALRWFEQAWQLGHHDAAEVVLALRQRRDGKLSTAQWLEAERPQLPGQLPADPMQQLGLWHMRAEQADAEWPFWLQAGLTDQPGWQPEAGCQLTLQPLAVTEQGAVQWLQIQEAWQQDEQLQSLAVCFQPLRLISSTELACSEQADQRIECQYQALIPYVQNTDAQQLIIMAGRGRASYNNGIIQLPERADLALLRHEFLHIFNFIDEYRLPAEVAREVCRPERIHANILIGKSQLTAYQQYWGLLPQQLELTEVPTCQHSEYQAYRLIAASNSMEYYQLPMPDFYRQLVQQQLATPEKLMPVQYYLAYQARLHELDAEWLRLMQLADELGYADAERLLNQRLSAPTVPVPVSVHSQDSIVPAASGG